MAGAVDVVSHTERGRNGHTVLHSSYSLTSVTLCSWRSGGWVGAGGVVCPGEFMAICDCSSEIEIQGGIFFIILNVLLHRKLHFFYSKKSKE